MFVSHKNNILLKLADTEWNCRSKSKGMTKPEYWSWIETITSGDPPKVTYPSEDFTIIEIQDENVSMRLSELDSYVVNTPNGITYNIKVYASKRNAEEIKDIDGKSFSPKQYKSSHFVGDDTAKDERILADKWANVRSERNRKLAETDYLALSDNTLSNDMKKYRDALRDVPSDNSDPDNINWPVKP
ncbi:MAG: hypothetical protein Unbinned202contig1000_42 [Prokaryotic dsDNA virus sp.]|nr:MAG: hypothetical protein Unbinned202contig1000_42 [Prokaryotic dsDNA virus sp.]|tara:strand:- start:15664 stop:16224 length:561 start_codon:yes stop_codon:yes gene_type:complete